MSYIYETHCHTSEASKCGKITPVDLVRFYKNYGFDGVCITEHFFNGNTSVPEDLPWNERVESFCRGYEKALEEGMKIGIDVFWGWEYSYAGSHFLTYGLDKQWLLNNSDLLDLDLNEYCDYVRKSGGFIVHAHPFTEAHYVNMIRLIPRSVDGVEVINAKCSDFENERAFEYAKNYGLLQIAGTDNHTGPADRLAGIKTQRRLKSIHDMISAIKNKETSIFEINYGEKIKV